jgi:hypothetical protein
MKKLFLTALVVLLAAGGAWAVDIETTGSYYVRGKFTENHNLATDSNAVQNPMTYDHDLVLNVSFVQSETTKVVTKIAVRDETWLTSGTAGTEQSAGAGNDDDNIKFERVWLHHVFPTNTVLDAGLMPGGTWAYTYADLETNNYRVKVTQPLSENAILVGLVEKSNERSGGTTAKDAEKDDKDGYALAGIFKFGNFSVKPLWQHVIDGGTTTLASDEDEAVVDVFILGVDGSFGMIGFQAEADFASVDYATGTDPSGSGYYLDVWANMDMFKIGGAVAIDNYDEDTGFTFGMGEDWAPLMILTDDVYFGGGGSLKSGPNACTLFLVYGDVNFSDKMSMNAALGFFSSNQDKVATSQWYKASATEFNLGFAYNITDALTYSIGYGYATVTYDDAYSADDPENLQTLYHKIKLSF